MGSLSNWLLLLVLLAVLPVWGLANAIWRHAKRKTSNVWLWLATAYLVLVVIGSVVAIANGTFTLFTLFGVGINVAWFWLARDANRLAAEKSVAEHDSDASGGPVDRRKIFEQGPYAPPGAGRE